MNKEGGNEMRPVLKFFKRPDMLFITGTVSLLVIAVICTILIAVFEKTGDTPALNHVMSRLLYFLTIF